MTDIKAMLVNLARVPRVPFAVAFFKGDGFLLKGMVFIAFGEGIQLVSAHQDEHHPLVGERQPHSGLLLALPTGRKTGDKLGEGEAMGRYNMSI
jgi:hypothetical protein